MRKLFAQRTNRDWHKSHYSEEELGLINLVYKNTAITKIIMAFEIIQLKDLLFNKLKLSYL